MIRGRSRNLSLNFSVVVCRIRFLSTLISKIKWLGSELPLNFFLVRITKDLGCYDQLAFKFIKQAKSVFNKTSEDYDKWIPDTYVPINLCGTPSTEAGFQINSSQMALWANQIEANGAIANKNRAEIILKTFLSQMIRFFLGIGQL